MKVLILYHVWEKRQTIDDHLYCFKRYAKDHQFHYCEIESKLPWYLHFVKYDAIFFHYTLLCLRSGDKKWRKLLRNLRCLKDSPSVKIAFPQDEYYLSKRLCELFKAIGIETVYTCAAPCDYATLYPRDQSGLKHYFSTLPGFIDEDTLSKIQGLHGGTRDIDIGYRARRLPYWLGWFGQIKADLGDAFLGHKPLSRLKMDISNDPADVFYGDDWMRFILRCRTMIGCLGGASLHDPEGAMRKQVEAYLKTYPKADFSEVSRQVFKDKDNSLSLFTLSPRHFECAMAKTCQVLVEGDYLGILQPNKHYIEVKRDFSNIEEVLAQISNHELCAKIAEQTYQDLVLPGKYTYSRFVSEVMSHVRTCSLRSYTTGSFLNEFLFKLVSVLLTFKKGSDALKRLGKQLRQRTKHPRRLLKDWIQSSLVKKEKGACVD